jgi:hypothetical protein
VAISPVTSDNTYRVSATELTPAKKSDQAAKTKDVSVPNTDSVELSHSAQIRSLRLQGLSTEMIAIKLGLDLSAVKQYLGIVEPDKNTATRSTYVKPRSTYVEPKATYSESNATTQIRDQLTQDINQLNKATFAWPRILDKPPPIIKTTAP